MALLSTVSRSNLNLEMLVFVEGGKPEYPEKNPRSRDENQQQTQPTYDAESANRTRATLVGGKCSHNCAIPALRPIPAMVCVGAICQSISQAKHPSLFRCSSSHGTFRYLPYHFSSLTFSRQPLSIASFRHFLTLPLSTSCSSASRHMGSG